MVPPDVDAQGGIVPLGSAHSHFRPEVCPLVVEVDQPGGAKEGCQVVLQQVAVLAYEGVQQPLVLLCKPTGNTGPFSDACKWLYRTIGQGKERGSTSNCD